MLAQLARSSCATVFHGFTYRLLRHAVPGLAGRLAGKRLILPAYRVVSNENLPHIQQLCPYHGVRQVAADLECLLAQYAPVRLPEVLRSPEAGCDFDRASVPLTFDDGSREIYDVVAPLLKAKGVPATFFLIIDVLDNR